MIYKLYYFLWCKCNSIYNGRYKAFCFSSSFINGKQFEIVLLVALSIQDNFKLLKQLESGFKRTINWNKYQSNMTKKSEFNINLFNPFIFWRSKQIFCFFFQRNAYKTRHTSCLLPIGEIKDYNVITVCQTVFDQPIKNDRRTYKNINKITKSQGDQLHNSLLQINHIFLKN